MGPSGSTPRAHHRERQDGSLVVRPYLLGPPVNLDRTQPLSLLFETAGQYRLDLPAAGSPGPATLVSAILPGSRSVQIGASGNGVATAFATVLATGPATGCTIQLLDPQIYPGLTYRETNPATNAPIGSTNALFDIAPGVPKTFVLVFTAASTLQSKDVRVGFSCPNTTAAIVPGVNTILLSVSLTATPDIVALGATVTNDGIANIPGTTGTGFFSVATVNVGAGAPITATVDTGSATTLPVVLSLCQTNPGTGACINPTTPGSSATVQIDANQTPTFAIFVRGTGNVAFNPGVNRAFVRFKTGGGATVGATSVAIRTQ